MGGWMGGWMDNVGKGHHKNKWEMRMMTGWGMRECVMRCLFGGKLSLSLSVVVRTSRTSWNFEEPSYRTIRCGSFLNRLRLSLVVSKKEGTGREKQRFEDSESNERHQLTNLLDKTN